MAGPRYAVLQFGSGGGGTLMMEPIRPDKAELYPAGVHKLGVLQLPFSARLVSLSPPRLFLPGLGECSLDDIVRGSVQSAGLVWEPAS